jgi:hypothetical protein
VGLVVDKVALVQVFSPSTSVSPANLHSITYHPGLVQQTSSGRSTKSPIAQIKTKKVVLIIGTKE